MGSRRLTAGIMKGTPCVFAVLLSLLFAASHAAPGGMGPPPGQSPPHPDPPHPAPTTEAAMPSPPTFNDGETVKAGESMKQMSGGHLAQPDITRNLLLYKKFAFRFLP